MEIRGPGTWSKYLLESAAARLSAAVTVLEIKEFYNVVITVLLIFYCWLSPTL